MLVLTLHVCNNGDLYKNTSVVEGGLNEPINTLIILYFNYVKYSVTEF